MLRFPIENRKRLNFFASFDGLLRASGNARKKKFMWPPGPLIDSGTVGARFQGLEFLVAVPPEVASELVHMLMSGLAS